ncbi:Ylr104w protein [Myxozyma melibiosi]|uniref:Long chronological lifespan protein 2 n=1 Tax=Myxozyma melibiosi TaxID=54550 RepID=A0ABR1F5D4_9ASCO
MRLLLLLGLLLLQAPLLASAQFDFFEHMFEGAAGGGGGHHRQQHGGSSQGSPQWYEQNYETVECKGYVCQDTLSCVKRPIDCPCLFPDSEEKCVLPDKKNYVCISKNGRGCGFVEKAWKGEV